MPVASCLEEIEHASVPLSVQFVHTKKPHLFKFSRISAFIFMPSSLSGLSNFGKPHEVSPLPQRPCSSDLLPFSYCTMLAVVRSGGICNLSAISPSWLCIILLSVLMHIIMNAVEYKKVTFNISLPLFIYMYIQIQS